VKVRDEEWQCCVIFLIAWLNDIISRVICVIQHCPNTITITIQYYRLIICIIYYYILYFIYLNLVIYQSHISKIQTITPMSENYLSILHKNFFTVLERYVCVCRGVWCRIDGGWCVRHGNEMMTCMRGRRYEIKTIIIRKYATQIIRGRCTVNSFHSHLLNRRNPLDTELSSS